MKWKREAFCTSFNFHSAPRWQRICCFHSLSMATFQKLLIRLFIRWATVSEVLGRGKSAILTAHLCLSASRFLEILTMHRQEANNNNEDKSPDSSKQFGWPRSPQLFLKVFVSDNFQLWLGLHFALVSYGRLEFTCN